MAIILGEVIFGAVILALVRQIVRDSAEKRFGIPIRWGARLYVLSFGILLAYTLAMFFISTIRDADQFIYISRSYPTGFIYVAGTGMVISSLILIISGILERGFVLLIFPVLMVVSVALIAPAISYLSGVDEPLATLRLKDHVYYVAPLAESSSVRVQLIECNSLGVVCRHISENTAADFRDFDPDNSTDRLEHDLETNTIIWLRGDDVIASYTLED